MGTIWLPRPAWVASLFFLNLKRREMENINVTTLSRLHFYLKSDGKNLNPCCLQLNQGKKKSTATLYALYGCSEAQGNLFLFILPVNKAPKSMAGKIPLSYQTLITL